VADDLAAISEHLERYEVDRPERILDRLHDAFLALGDMPERFSLLPRYETAGIRRRVVGNYLIFYRVQDETVVVLRILHGAQDYESILFPEP
jgi:plasmid stabilization system protein ParE